MGSRGVGVSIHPISRPSWLQSQKQLYRLLTAAESAANLQQDIAFKFATRAALACRPEFRYTPPFHRPLVRARSSAGEHYVDIVGVTGSIPVAPTILPFDMSMDFSALSIRQRVVKLALFQDFNGRARRVHHARRARSNSGALRQSPSCMTSPSGVRRTLTLTPSFIAMPCQKLSQPFLRSRT